MVKKKSIAVWAGMTDRAMTEWGVRGGQRDEPEGGGKSEVKPVTEWAGMTDWVVALRERSPVKRKEDKR